MLHQTIFRSPIGRLIGLSSSKGLILLAFEQEDQNFYHYYIEKHFPKQPIQNSLNGHLKQTEKWLTRYFVDPFAATPLPAFDLIGSPFAKQLWLSLAEILPGSLKTYKNVAEALNKPSASRCVGRLIGDNPLGLMLPCHRVIGSNGKLTGYRGGLERKAWLLHHEKATVGADRRARPRNT